MKVNVSLLILGALISLTTVAQGSAEAGATVPVGSETIVPEVESPEAVIDDEVLYNDTEDLPTGKSSEAQEGENDGDDYYGDSGLWGPSMDALLEELERESEERRQRNGGRSTYSDSYTDSQENSASASGSWAETIKSDL